jgi:hypothetical protein
LQARLIPRPRQATHGDTHEEHHAPVCSHMVRVCHLSSVSTSSARACPYRTVSVWRLVVPYGWNLAGERKQKACHFSSTGIGRERCPAVRP